MRTHLGRVDIIDFAGDGAPEWRGPIFFSSPGVAWSWTAGDIVPESAPPSGAVLLRSDDAGVTWREVSTITGAARRLDLVVDEDSARGWTLGVNESLASFGTPGPYVFAGSIATDRISLHEASPILLPPPAPEIPEGRAGPILWAAGDSVAHGPTILGLLLRSDDGGRTWIEALGRPGGSFRDVDFVDRRTGWVVGGGRILRTDDGGASFVDQTDNVELESPPSEARVVSAADASHAIVVGYGFPAEADYPRDVVLFTNDGGASWSPGALPRGFMPLAMDAVP